MIVLGRYKETYQNDKYPSIHNDLSKFCGDKKKTVEYMKKCRVTSYAPAIMTDVITGKRITEPLACMTDGVYGWRSDLIYYVEHYDLKLPEDFMKHISDNS